MTLLPFHRRERAVPATEAPCCWVAAKDPAGGPTCPAHQAAIRATATAQARASYSINNP